MSTKVLFVWSLNLHFGCYSIIGSDDVIELDHLILTVTDLEATNYKGVVHGTALNVGDTTISAPWYIKAMFYSYSSFVETFGGDNARINYYLEPNVTGYWTLEHSYDGITESEYPNFAVKGLRSFKLEN